MPGPESCLRKGVALGNLTLSGLPTGAVGGSQIVAFGNGNPGFPGLQSMENGLQAIAFPCETQ